METMTKAHVTMAWEKPLAHKNMKGVTPEEAYRIICDDIRAIYREP